MKNYSLPTLLRIVVTFALLFGTSFTATAQRSLFSDSEEVDTRDIDRVNQRKSVWENSNNVLEVREAVLSADFNLVDNDQIRLRLHETIIVADRLFLEQNGPTWTWSGNIRDTPGTVVLTFVPNEGMTGSIILEDLAEDFQIEPVSTSAHLVIRRTQAEVGDDTPLQRPEESGKNIGSPAPKIAGGSLSGTTPIRVLFVYTSAAKNAMPNIAAKTTTAIAEVNTFLINQGIYLINGGSQSFRFSKRHSAQVSYNEGSGQSNDYSVHLNNLKNNQVGNAISLRNSYGADVTVLVVNGQGWCSSSSNPPNCAAGQAFRIPAANVNHSFIVIDKDVLNGGTTLAHEFTHLFGGKHANDITTQTGYSYAYGYLIQPIWKKTIVAGGLTAGTYISRFSSASHNYQGHPLGNATKYDVVRGLKNYHGSIASFKSDPTLSVSISGPNFVNSGSNGTWYANPSGGGSEYNCFEWSYRPASSSTWIPEGYLQCDGTNHYIKNITQTTYIKVDAYDDDGQSATATWYVTTSGGYSVLPGDQEQPTVLPETTRLSQNYPNPFNPSTSISFNLINDGHVTLTVRDLLGRTVSVLVNEWRTKGTYAVPWEAHYLPGGVYFYTLQTADATETRQMTLLK